MRSANTYVLTVAVSAYDEYSAAYTTLLDTSTPDYTKERMELVKSRQIAHDKYHASVDPAAGIFNAHFGHQWSKQFIREFLFSLSIAE